MEELQELSRLLKEIQFYMYDLVDIIYLLL